jgi:hypothetical protein
MKKLFLLFILIPLFGSAQIKTVWKDTRFMKEPLKKVMVFSQFYNADQRLQAEENIVQALENKGIGAVSASSILIYDSMYYYSTLERILDSAGAEGLLIVKLIEERSTDLYIMPEEFIPPYAYNYYEYYSFYYYHDLPIISDPNYYRKPGRTFRIDIYLYQNKGDMAIWGGRSKQVDPLKPEKVIKSLGIKVTKKMLSEEVISE